MTTFESDFDDLVFEINKTTAMALHSKGESFRKHLADLVVLNANMAAMLIERAGQPEGH